MFEYFKNGFFDWTKKLQEKTKQLSIIKKYPEYEVSMAYLPNNYELQLFGLWCIIFDDLHRIAKKNPSNVNNTLASYYKKVTALKIYVGQSCSEFVFCWFEETIIAFEIFLEKINSTKYHADQLSQIHCFGQFCFKIEFLLDLHIKHELSLGPIVSSANDDKTDYTNPKNSILQV